MTILQAVILGVVQGISEFLPISSSGHLLLLKHYFNIPEVPIIFDIMLHTATLLAVCIMFRKSIGERVRASVHSFRARQWRSNEVVLIFCASVATSLVAVGLRSFLYTNVRILGSAFFITALILASTLLRKNRKEAPAGKQLSLISALVIGLLQGIAVLPGISRSGITIVAGLHLGLSQKRAAEFSFFLAIPAILGAMMLGIPDIHNLHIPISVILTGMACAFVAGYYSLWLLLRLLQSGALYIFAPYLFFAALLCFVQ